MNTFEDQVRTELHDALSAAGPALPQVDTADVIDAGHATVRRRRLTAIGGVAAFAVAVAVGASLIGGPDRASDLRPGVSTPARGTAVATLELPGPLAERGIQATRFIVKIGPNAMPSIDGGPTPAGDLAYYAIVDGEEQLMGGSSVDGVGAIFGHGAGTDVVIGIVPADAVEASLQADGIMTGQSPSELVAVPGTAFKAIAFRLGEIPTTEPYIQPIWWRADGTPVTNDGAGTVIRFTHNNLNHDLWAIKSADLYGHRVPGGGGASFLSTLFADGVADIDATSGYIWDSTRTPVVVSGELIHFYVIKGRARELNGTFDSRVKQPFGIQSDYWSDLDATVVLAQGTLPATPATQGETVPLLTRLTWTDAKGAQQSHDFR